MSNQKYFFSVDLGATSGRTIVGRIVGDKFELEEVTRFPNNLIVQGGHYYWDIYALYFEIIKGLKEVARSGLEITSIGIDTWGVDFVFIGKDNANESWHRRGAHADGQRLQNSLCASRHSSVGPENGMTTTNISPHRDICI